MHPPPGDCSDQGIKPASLKSPALAGKIFTTSVTWEAPLYHNQEQNERWQYSCQESFDKSNSGAKYITYKIYNI